MNTEKDTNKFKEYPNVATEKEEVVKRQTLGWQGAYAKSALEQLAGIAKGAGVTKGNLESANKNFDSLMGKIGIRKGVKTGDKTPGGKEVFKIIPGTLEVDPKILKIAVALGLITIVYFGGKAFLGGDTRNCIGSAFGYPPTCSDDPQDEERTEFNRGGDGTCKKTVVNGRSKGKCLNVTSENECVPC